MKLKSGGGITNDISGLSLDGKVITTNGAVYNSTNYTIRVQFTDGTSMTTTSLKGATGLKGDSITGNPGAPGAPGAPGIPGIPGVPGGRGRKGDDGDTGNGISSVSYERCVFHMRGVCFI